jgi:hypothetical protein
MLGCRRGALSPDRGGHHHPSGRVRADMRHPIPAFERSAGATRGQLGLLCRPLKSYQGDIVLLLPFLSGKRVELLK